MKLKTTVAGGALALASVLALSACAGGDNAGTSPAASSSSAAPTVDYSSLSGTITAGGSSAQGNAEAAWTAAIKAQAPSLTVNYDKSQGSGGGVTNWLAGSYDFAGSDSPLKPEQVTSASSVCTAGDPVDVPIYLDGVAIIYKLSGVSNLQLSGATLAKIFNLQITNWNDPAIKADNPSATLPDLPITTVARSDGSGTTQNFSNYLVGTQKDNWPYDASNAWPVQGNVSKQQGGSGVVNAVEAGNGTIGYADHSAIGNATSAAIGVNGDFVKFSSDAATEAFSKAATANPSSVAGDMSVKFDYSKFTDGSAYPIPLVSYAIFCKTFKDSKQAELVKGYMSFILSETGQKVAAKNAGSAPLPSETLDQANQLLAEVK